ncbi:MAG TPA: hypothetical protein VJ486_07000 [Geothrix sp.]|nr:hypothetical protein [Geothrix sp.]
MTTDATPRTQAAAAAKRTDAEKIEALCLLIVGGMSKTKAVKEVFGDGRKYWEATAKNFDFQYQVAQAQEIYADALVDEAVDIADTDPDPNRARNRADVRKWLASKLKPKSYGDRMELAVQHGINISSTIATARGRVISKWADRSTVDDAEIVAPSDLQLSESNPGLAIEPDIFS